MDGFLSRLKIQGVCVYICMNVCFYVCASRHHRQMFEKKRSHVLSKNLGEHH